MTCCPLWLKILQTSKQALQCDLQYKGELHLTKTDKRHQVFQRRYGYRLIRMLLVGLHMGLANLKSRFVQG